MFVAANCNPLLKHFHTLLKATGTSHHTASLAKVTETIVQSDRPENVCQSKLVILFSECHAHREKQRALKSQTAISFYFDFLRKNRY